MSFQHTPQTIIDATTGSHAYGLSHEHSDIDTMRVIVQPTSKLIGTWMPPKSVIHRTDPDVTEYELGHLISLLLKSNPTVTEILWLPDDCYRMVSTSGEELIRMRHLFLSAEYVHDTYLAYLKSQIKLIGRLEPQEGKERRIVKIKRHIKRLDIQARELWTTGQMVVRSDAREEILAAGTATGEELEGAHAALTDFLDRNPTPLHPVVPDASRGHINDWLVKTRFSFF